MKYQFITINRYCVGDSTDQVISEKLLQEYLRGFPKEDVHTFGKDWYGYDGEEETYIWKKLAK